MATILLVDHQAAWREEWIESLKEEKENVCHGTNNFTINIHSLRTNQPHKMEDVPDLRVHKIDFCGGFITIGREGSMKVFSAQDNKQTLPTMKKRRQSWNFKARERLATEMKNVIMI